MATQYEKRKAKEAAATKAAPVKKKVSKVKKQIKELKDKLDNVVLDKITYDIFFDPEKHTYVEVTIEYSLEDNIARIKESKEVSTSQPMAVYRSKQIFIDKLMKR